MNKSEKQLKFEKGYFFKVKYEVPHLCCCTDRSTFLYSREALGQRAPVEPLAKVAFYERFHPPVESIFVHLLL